MAVRTAAYQTVSLQGGHEFGHRWRLDLLDARQFRQPHRPAKHEDRENRKPGGPDASVFVFLSQAAQQVDGRRM